MRLRPIVISLFVCLSSCAQLPASVVGTSKPAESLTAERIATLPAKDRDVWMAYLKRSQQQMLADKAALAAELKPGETAPLQPAEGFGGGRSMSLHHEAAWYGTTEARHVADVIVSFQTPAGGWSKNMSMSGALRLPGQPYAADNLSKFLSPDDFDMPKDPHWRWLQGRRRGRMGMPTGRASCGAFSTCWRRSFRMADGRRCGRWRVDTTTPSLSTTTQ